MNFQIFPVLVQEKCEPQQKLRYLAKNVLIWCRTIWSIFVYNLVTIEQKIEKWWRRINPTYLTSKMPNSCRIKKKEQIKKNKCIKKKRIKKIGYIELHKK